MVYLANQRVSELVITLFEKASLIYRRSNLHLHEHGVIGSRKFNFKVAVRVARCNSTTCRKVRALVLTVPTVSYVL